MRSTLFFLALFPVLAAAQTSPQQPHPQKVLTPEQIASAAYTAEMAREKAGDCPNAKSTYAINMCLAHEDELTGANLKAFAAAIRAMLAPASPGEPEEPYIGPTGTAATPATNTAAFDKAQAAWQAYATAECDAVDTYWRGGTIRSEE